MQQHEGMICAICGKENPSKHQDFCVELGCSGTMIVPKIQLIPSKFTNESGQVTIAGVHPDTLEPTVTAIQMSEIPAIINRLQAIYDGEITPVVIFFEEIWRAFDGRFGAKGSKKKALAAFKGVPFDMVPILVPVIEKQIAMRVAHIAAGEFCAQFPHVERWLRDERWNDEIVMPEQPTEANGVNNMDNRFA